MSTLAAAPLLAPDNSAVLVRRLSPADSMEEITSLLHRAYRAQMDMGLSPLAGRLDVDTTRRRCASGECYIAVMPTDSVEKIVGTILFHEVEDAKGPPWFANADVDSFSQFAVDPDIQGKGIGQLLLETVELRAAQCGARHLGLSMAEPDTKLRAFYERRGYRFVELWQWPYTNYKSAILSKQLRE